MELYSMPQLDKTSPVFSDAQYEGGGDNINNQRTPTNDVKKYATVPADALPLLTSSASWNAVIHHPAEEDSEPDDLPSTVDMDAIKGSPATPLTASKTPPSNGANSWTQSKGDRCKREGAKEEAEASESEDSDGEDESDSQESDEDGDSGDSDSVNGSGSDSEGSESESCSWTDSDSESGSSSCSSRSGHSSRSSHTHQTFSIRETNFEQGGLKLKIAALKVTRKSSGKDSSKESGKDVGKEPTKEVLRDAPREVTKESESKKPTAAPAPKSSKDKAKFEKLPTQTSIAAAVPSQMSASTTPAPTPTGKSPSKVAVANALKKSEGVRRKPRAGRSTQKDKVSSVSGRNLCSMRVPASPTLYGCTAAGLSRGRTHVPHTPRSNTDTEDESESDEDEEEAEISQIAQELGHIEQGNIAISEHLQEINQEDLAAILPDVVTTDNHGDEAGPPFDGFEDVSSESGKVAADGSATANVSQRGAESSSDMELPEQVVSEAIKRIHIDSEEVQMRGNDSSSGEDSCEEGGLAEVTGYSSALLQQFVEKTEILASQAACSQDPAKVSVLTRAKREEPRRRKRGRPPKIARKVEEVPDNSNQAESSSSAAKCMPELEAYMRLDCSVSNVSPDSGIQSVAGSPVHHSCSPASHVAIHSPGSQAHKAASPVSSPHCLREATPPPPTLLLGEERPRPVKRGPGRPPRNLKVARRGPGRPKGSGKKAKAERQTRIGVTGDSSVGDSAAGVMTVCGNESCDEIPPTPSPVPIAPIKRGPGRPKKAPPVLEPNLPITLPEQRNKREGELKSPVKKKGSSGIKASEEISVSEVRHSSVPVPKQLYKSSVMLSEICERVSKRLDQSSSLLDSAVTVSETKKLSSKFSKTKASKESGSQKRVDVPVWPKSNKGRRKREKEDSSDTSERPSLVHTSKQKNVSNSVGSPVSAPHKTVFPRTVAPRVFGLPTGMSHHKHKKRKKKAKPPRVEKSITDPTFLMDLEKLALDFSRCTIGKGELPVSSKTGEVSLPSIFRVKRIVKKRKGSEKSRASDRESGTEGDGGKEKSRQRRPKKNLVETPKGHERPEANNEQRLPLKKRHYHISTAANLPASSSSPEIPRTESTGDSARKAASSERIISTDKEKLNDKVNVGNVLSVTGKNQSKPSDKVIVSFKEKPSDKGNSVIGSANKNNCVIEIKSKSVSELPRNSIDEAIEACITRYTTTSPPLEKPPVATRTVIVTPKKRHRLENAAVVCTSGRTTNVTICKGKDSAVETTVTVNNINKSINTLGNTPHPSKRSGSRSASANSSSVLNTSGSNAVQLSLPSAVEPKSPSAAVELHSKTTEIDESSSVNSVIKTVTSPSKVTSPSSKIPSPVKGCAPASKGISVGKVASPEKKGVSSMNKVSQPSGKTNLPGSKTTSPVGKLASVLSKISSPSKTPSTQVSKGISPSNKVSSPTGKLACSPSSPIKVVPNNASKGIVAVSKTSTSAANKVVSTSSKIASPSKRTKTSLLSNKSGSSTTSPVRKTTSPTVRLASPGSRGKRALSPTNKTVSPAEKTPAESTPVTKLTGASGKVGGILNKASSSNSKCVGGLQGRAGGRVNKVPVSAGRATAAKTLISGKLTSPRAITVCNRTLLSARRSIGLGRGSSKVSTAVSRVSIGANRGTAKTLSRLHSSLRTVEENVPVFHNLRVKRANGAADKDDVLFKRNKKKRLIRDVRVHVTKLSPMDLLKKAVGAVKERARRRKSINRTGFPVKKKKKKRPQLFEHHTSFSDTLETATSASVQRANESSLPAAPVPVIDSKPKTISCSDSNEILPASSTEIVEHMLDTNVELQQSKRDQSSGLSETTPKPKVRKSDSSKLETVEVVQSSDSKPKEANKRERYNSVLPDRGNGNDDDDDDDYDDDDDDDDDTDTESDMVESRPLGSCKRYKGGSCHMVEDRTDEELSVCAADDSNVLQVCDNRARGKRKRDSSHDEVNHSSFAHVPSKRLRKIRDYDMDRDDISDLALPYESLPCSDVPSGDESTKSGRRKKQPRWRKKFLAAGLFSDYFKEDEPRRPSGDTGKSRLLYRPEEHQHGLLPPPYHCGKYLRQRRVEFRLPYDLWWLHTHSQLPGRDCVPSWNYKKIRTNVYYDVKPTYTYEAQACNCVLPMDSCRRGCGEDCINRMVYAECSPQLCPCRDLCSNQRIQKHEWAPGLEKFMTKDKGWGVKTKYAIKSGEFILEYVGEVVSEKEFKDRMASRYVSDTHHYCLNLDGGLVIDGHRMGGDGRFVNHSCEPNCEMQKWSVNGLFRMALFALRDIQPHEELSYDYNFSLFNPAEGQPCKCGSVNCRGVIGGKSQRINGAILPPEEKPERRLVGRPRKNARKNSSNVSSNKLKYKKRLGEGSSTQKHSYMTPVKPMSHQQRCFAQLHHCFLLRNLEKVKRLRERLKQASRREQPLACGYPRPQVKQSDVFLTQLNALSTPRNIRTRRLAQAEDNPELTKTARLAYVFRDLYNVVIAAKDERTEMLCAPFLTLPSKRKLPEYYQRISEPIDLGTLEQNIVTGYYRTVESFDQDMNRLFANNVRFFGRTSELGITAARLRKVYNEAKLAFLPQLEEILGESPPASFIPERDPGGEEEDVIRCICGLYKDEGMMIQCERCLVWQHCDCVRADEGVEHYLCEQCSPRPVDLEIIMSPQPPYATPGLTYYITLLRGSLQLRQGDTVYVLRDMIEENAPKTSPPTKHTYKTIKDFKYTDFDIFRIERLWKDEKGERFAFGHHYLRPHETYHEPSRKFFPNEVMRVPLYEVVPLDLIMGHCWVLDLNTFCKGRPVGATEEHIYICEYRVDKSAHLFTKIAKPRHSVCTKAYAFETFDRRLKPQRTYTPHGPVAPRSRGRSAGSRAAEEEAKGVQATPSQDDDEELPLARVRDDALARKRANQKQRLNMILLRLLARLPSKQPLDLSFLLEPGRRHRKKTSILNP